MTLEFTITNFDRNEALTNISFTDDLDAVLSGLVATGLPQNDICGSGSTLSGTSLLSLSGGSLDPEGSCTFSVSLQVPSGATPGDYPNTTSALSGERGGTGVLLNTASDTLVAVIAAPVLTKTFLDPVAAGGSVTLRFAITNTSPISNATSIAFDDELTSIFGGSVSTNLPQNDVCGADSSLTQVDLGTGRPAIRLTGGNLSPGGTCTFDVVINIPTDFPGGSYVNTTGNISASLEGTAVTGGTATDNLDIVAAPTFRKNFVESVVTPGSTAVLEFSLDHSAAAAGSATNIAFTDDLSTLPVGSVITDSLPLNNICSAGSQLSLSGSTLVLTGGRLNPGGSCDFSIHAAIPASAASGDYVNTAGAVTADVAGLATTGSAPSATLSVVGLLLTKSFTDDPALPGGNVTLQFTLSNTSVLSDATAITFQDDLGNVLSGLTPTDLPQSDICGIGSSLTFSGDTITFAGGSVNANSDCTFSTLLSIPGGAASNSYLNATSAFQATIDSATVFPPNATDLLVIDTERLQLSKNFLNDPVPPSDSVVLEFTLTIWTQPTQSIRLLLQTIWTRPSPVWPPPAAARQTSAGLAPA